MESKILFIGVIFVEDQFFPEGPTISRLRIEDANCNLSILILVPKLILSDGSTVQSSLFSNLDLK